MTAACSDEEVVKPPRHSATVSWKCRDDVTRTGRGKSTVQQFGWCSVTTRRTLLHCGREGAEYVN